MSVGVTEITIIQGPLRSQWKRRRRTIPYTSMASVLSWVTDQFTLPPGRAPSLLRMHLNIHTSVRSCYERYHGPAVDLHKRRKLDSESSLSLTGQVKAFREAEGECRV